MTLADETEIINYMIRVNPDSTIADYLQEYEAMQALENEIMHDRITKQIFKPAAALMMAVKEG